MNRSFSILLILSVFFGGLLSAVADDQASIKARMLKRLPTIVALAKRGVVSENNQGQLTPKGSMSASEKVIVNAENTDRVAAYTLIAKKAKASVSSVGRQRAAQIRKSAAKGTWVQKTDGSWVKA